MEADIDDDILELEEVLSDLSQQAQARSGASQRIILMLQFVIVLFGFIRCCIKSKASVPDCKIE